MVMQNNLFYQRYMWFVGLLMLFFVIFGCFYQARPLWFATRSRAKIDNSTAFLSDFKIILGIGFITFIGSTINIFAMFILAQEVSNPETWLSLGNMVQFRLSRIFLHFTYFLLGITAYKNHWFEQGRLTNHARAKGICLAALVVLFLVAKNQMQNGPDHLEQFYGLVFWFVLNFLCITALGFFLSLCFRYMAEPTRFNTVMAKNSYNIYLSHYIFIIIFQLALLPVGWMPSLLKFMVISVFGLLSSFAASHYLVQKRPGFTVIMLFCLVFILFLFIR